MHSLNIQLILETLDVFHFDISFNDFKESHLQNIFCIKIILDTFHCDIFGSEYNKLHSSNIKLALLMVLIPISLIFIKS